MFMDPALMPNVAAGQAMIASRIPLSQISRICSVALPPMMFNWGLAGLICSLLISVLGIIFSAIAMSKAKHCLNDYGFLPQQARNGRTMGIIGLVIGIVSTVIGILAVVLIVFAMAYTYY